MVTWASRPLPAFPPSFNRRWGRVLLTMLCAAALCGPKTAQAKVPAAPPTAPKSRSIDTEQDSEKAAPSSSDSSTSSDSSRRLSFFERNYFITAFGGSNAVKFQLSIKFDLWPTRAWQPQAGSAGRRHGVYFAFTQRALWDIYDLKDSSAIASMDFQPEVFYRYVQAGPADPGCNIWSGNVAVQHISNGLSGDDSRAVQWVVGRLNGGCSWNPTSSAFAPYLQVQLDVWSPPIYSFENPAVADYLAPLRLELSVATKAPAPAHNSSGAEPWYGRAEATFSVRPGAAGHIISYQVETAWRPGLPRGMSFFPYLYAQYWNGYGETLINYDRHTEAFRVGIGVSEQH